MRAGAHSARELELAVMKAEGQLKRPKGPNETVLLMPSEIKTRPELFQVREFSFGMTETVPDHVKNLTRSIGIHGELDPPTVIKLGTKFVCVEGHHRLAAYKDARWAQPITCKWFPGSVREAVDESMRLNAKDRLNVPKPDKAERAWKYTLLGWGSKAEVVKLCDVGDGTVAEMRRCVRLANDDSEQGAEFRRIMGLGGRTDLLDTSWSQVKLAKLGLEPEKADEQKQAERLARRMRARLSDLLSRDAKVTARALEFYDPELPKEIVRAWGVEAKDVAATEPGDAEEEAPEAALISTDAGLKLALERRRKQVAAHEAEIKRRANGGVSSDAAQDLRAV